MGFFSGFFGGFIGGVSGVLVGAWVVGGMRLPKAPTSKLFKLKQVLADTTTGTQITQYLQPNNTFGNLDTAIELNQSDAARALQYFRSIMPTATFSAEPVTPTVNANADD